MKSGNTTRWTEIVVALLGGLALALAVGTRGQGRAAALEAAFLSGATAQADRSGGPGPIDTLVTLDPPASVPVGEAPYVVARLTTAEGLPLAREPLELYVGGQYAGRARTDASGTALLRGSGQLPVGEHAVMVIYYGSPVRGLRPSSGETVLSVDPFTIEIETVPALPQVRFQVTAVSLGNEVRGDQLPVIVLSDEEGVARIEVDAPGDYQIEVLPWEDVDPEARAEFARWLDEVFQPDRVVSAKPGLRLVVGFLVSFRVSQSFVDLAGRPLDPMRVSALQLKSSVGERLLLNDGEPRWISGVRVSSRSSGLEAVDIVYRVESVTLDGVEGVVNRNQQDFTPRLERHWVITLLTYSAQIRARDAFFGTPVGTAVLIEFPTGNTLTVPLDGAGTAFVSGLPRGEYRVSILGGGYSPPRPVAMTRDQDMSLDVISHLDMAIALGFVGTIGLGLLLIGRPQLVTVPYGVIRHPSRLLPRSASAREVRS